MFLIKVHFSFDNSSYLNYFQHHTVFFWIRIFVFLFVPSLFHAALMESRKPIPIGREDLSQPDVCVDFDQGLQVADFARKISLRTPLTESVDQTILREVFFASIFITVTCHKQAYLFASICSFNFFITRKAQLTKNNDF